MNLRRLQAFRAVFEVTSVTSAAQRLNMTQPAVSRLISELEKELGLTLFVRERRRLVPTAEGRAFYREAERALAAVDQIVDIARDLRTLKGAHLRVVAPMITAFGIMPAAIEAFLAAYPQARVSLETKDIRDIADWVVRGPFDVGVTVLPFDDPHIECEPLATVHGVLVMPNDHRLARKRSVRLKDLCNERLILPSPGSPIRALLSALFEALEIEYQNSIDTPALSACQMTARRLGVTIVDPFTFQEASGLGIVSRPLKPPIEISFGFFFPANRSRSALVTAFVDATRSIIRSHVPRNLIVR
jgi:DNA-binding transcriptional LysR family regulator